MEITKREILFSIIIVAVLLTLGTIIADRINDAVMAKYEQYNTALQIDADESLFRYGMKTSVGNAFVYGELKAVDAVSFDELQGQYAYIRKVKEVYTEHTRQVAHTRTDSKGHTHTYYTTEVYYTWDYSGSWDKHSNHLSFLNVEFEYNQINIPEAHYITTIYKSPSVRYCYSGIDTKYTGTLYAKLQNNTIDHAKFYNNHTIEETLNNLECGGELIVFWILWIILICFTVVGFCFLDNRWLE